jgi:hypothetical protein
MLQHWPGQQYAAACTLNNNPVDSALISASIQTTACHSTMYVFQAGSPVVRPQRV